MNRPTIDDIRAAGERLSGIAQVTPLHSSGTLSNLVGRPVVLKAENLQLTGSFKIRGAYNTVAQLTEAEREAGVVTSSAGNHGQAVAWAARQAGIPATIFVPEGAPRAKFDAAERIIGKRLGFYRPDGGFYLWLDVGDGEAAAKRLWAEAAIRVMPGAYLARTDEAGRNPGQRFIRVALVHKPDAVETALKRLVKVL